MPSITIPYYTSASITQIIYIYLNHSRQQLKTSIAESKKKYKNALLRKSIRTATTGWHLHSRARFFRRETNFTPFFPSRIISCHGAFCGIFPPRTCSRLVMRWRSEVDIGLASHRHIASFPSSVC